VLELRYLMRPSNFLKSNSEIFGELHRPPPRKQQLSNADVLYVKVSFRQKPETLGVLAVFAYGNAFIFRVDSDNCYLLVIYPLSYAYFLNCCRLKSILYELCWVFW